MNKKLLSLALAGTIICAIPFNTYAKSSDWIESSDSEINYAVNKIKVYKDTIIVYTNKSNTNIRFYSDNDELLKEGSTDIIGNAILDIDGYHDLSYEDHYLEIGSDDVRVYLNDENKVEKKMDIIMIKTLMMIMIQVMLMIKMREFFLNIILLKMEIK